VTLDTPMNRKWMPDADHTTWTSLEYIAEYVLCCTVFFKQSRCKSSKHVIQGDGCYYTCTVYTISFKP